MIGVSVALALVYWFNWPFPHGLKLMEYEVPISALTIEVLAWVFLLYLVVEYYIHVRSQFDDIFQKWRTHLERHLPGEIERFLDQSTKEQITKKLDAKPPMVVGKYEVTYAKRHGDKLAVRVNVYGKRPDNDLIGPQVHGFEQILPLASIRWARLKATMGLVFTEGLSFEYILPGVFPVLAIGLWLFRKVQLWTSTAGLISGIG